MGIILVVKFGWCLSISQTHPQPEQNTILKNLKQSIISSLNLGKERGAEDGTDVGRCVCDADTDKAAAWETVESISLVVRANWKLKKSFSADKISQSSSNAEEEDVLIVLTVLFSFGSLI